MDFDGGRIRSVLDLDTDPYAMGMLRAESLARLFPDVVTSFLANPLLGVMEVAKDAGAALAEMFKEVTDNADDMGDLATQVGVSVEALTSLGAIAQMAGSSTSSAADSYKLLGKSLGAALNGSKSDIESFSRYGIAIRDLAGNARPVEEVMYDVADALAALPPGAQRTQLAMDLLGRSGTELIPTLAAGSAELRKQMQMVELYGATVTRTQVETADRWNDTMGEMGIASQGLRNSLVTPIRDALLPYLETLAGWVRTNQPQVRQIVQDSMKSIMGMLTEVGGVVDFVRNHFQMFGAFLLGLGAYLAGPAVAGAIWSIGPILLSLLSPMALVRTAGIALMAVFSPLTAVASLARIAFAGLAIAVAMNPQWLSALAPVIDVVWDGLQRLWVLVQTQLIPTLGQAFGPAIERVREALPSMADVVAFVQATFERYSTFLVGTWFPLLGRVAGVVGSVVAEIVPTVLAGIGGMIGWLTSTAVPAVQGAFASAWAFAGEAVNTAMPYFTTAGQVVRGVIGFITGTAVPAVAGLFSAAWSTASSAVATAQPAFNAIWGVMQSVAGWIGSEFVPAVQFNLAQAWLALGPVLEAAGGYFNMIWGVLAQVAGWIMSDAVPIVQDGFANAWLYLGPVMAGVGSILSGVWEIGRGVVAFIMAAVVPIVGDVLSIGITNLTSLLRTMADLIAWLWQNILRPVYDFLSGLIKPILETIGTIVGGLLGKIGDLLSWLGQSIRSAAELAGAVNSIPEKGATPQTPQPSPGPQASLPQDESIFFQPGGLPGTYIQPPPLSLPPTIGVPPISPAVQTAQTNVVNQIISKVQAELLNNAAGAADAGRTGTAGVAAQTVSGSASNFAALTASITEGVRGLARDLTPSGSDGGSRGSSELRAVAGDVRSINARVSDWMDKLDGRLVVLEREIRKPKFNVVYI